MGARFAWTDEAIAELRKLVADGVSASFIAAAISGRFGHDVSRNAIIGKTRRLGLQLGGDVHGAAAVVRRQRPKRKNVSRTQNFTMIGGYFALRERAQAPEVAPAPLPADLAPTLRFQDRLSGDCAWIPGESRGVDVMCCGRPTEGEKPYCSEHCAMAYTTVAAYRAGRDVLRRAA